MNPGFYLSKRVILDTDLNLTAKAIYLLFTVKAAGHITLQLGRDEILSILNISKQSYYTHLKILLDKGYIQREEQPNHDKSFHAGVFSLPKQAGLHFLLRSNDIIDADLSVKAKGLYSYYCAALGDPRYVPPTSNRILSDLGIRHRQYYRLRDELINAGFIDFVQKRQDGAYHDGIIGIARTAI